MILVCFCLILYGIFGNFVFFFFFDLFCFGFDFVEYLGMWYIILRLGVKFFDFCRLGRFILDNFILFLCFYFFCFFFCIVIKVFVVRLKEFVCFSCLVERFDRVFCRWWFWFLFFRRIVWYKFVFGMMFWI